MAVDPPIRRLGARYWLRILGASLLAAAVVTVVYSGVGWRTPPRRMLEAFGISLLFSLVIGPMLALVMPRVSRHVACRFAFPFDWAVLIATMIAIALAGSFTAILILAAIGYLHGAGIVATWMAGSLKASIVITLLFGIFVTLYESMRRRLDEATVALRTKERDEAEARRLAAEAQLASIESRVQPHFLFNTLNSIASLVHDDPDGAERMTGQLAALLRSSLDATGSPLVSVDEELRVVRAYLDIERVRFGDRLRYEIEIDEGAAGAPVPRLAVQTLVENSVKYAVSPRREGGCITVRAVSNNGHVRLSVADDGPGFDPAAALPGHGLALVRDRLAMTLGDRAALTVERRAAATVVSIDVDGVRPRDRAVTGSDPASGAGRGQTPRKM
jgi:two-component system, LytTR family, sensor histidine kinase AlgZ